MSYRVLSLSLPVLFAVACGGSVEFSPPVAERQFELLGELALDAPAARAIDFDGRYVLLSQGEGGLTVVDAEDPRTPRVAARYRPAQQRDGVVAFDRILDAVWLDAGHFVSVVDPACAGLCVLPPPDQELRVQAWTGSGDPRVVATLAAETTVAIAADAGWLFTSMPSERSSGAMGSLKVFDLRSPSSPRETARADLSTAGRLVVGSGGTLINAFSDAGGSATGFDRLDVTRPAQPLPLATSGTAAAAGSFGDAALAGQFLYQLDGGGRLFRIDVSSPRGPFQPVGLLGGAAITAFAVDADRLVLSRGGAPVQVYRLDRDRPPLLLDQLPDRGEVLHIALHGDLMLLASDQPARLSLFRLLP